jgi:hypothetical protein
MRNSMANNSVLEALFHFLFGFVYFLERNLGRMNFNADTLVPGCIAYGLVILLLHWKLRQLCRNRGRAWNFYSSFLVGLLLPAAFGISLLIPGVMLQLQELAAGR